MDSEEDRLLLIVLGTVLAFILLSTAHAMPLGAQVIACESGGEHWRGKHLNCNRHEPEGGQSCGIAQFQVATFKWMRHKAGIDTLDYNDPLHQIALLNWALDHGYGNHWTCYRKIKAGTWHITPALVRKMRGNRWIKLMYGGV